MDGMLGCPVTNFADNLFKAPELIQGESVRSKKTDVYALAMVCQIKNLVS